jgi:uncharacterized protein (DUF952 family)
MFKWIITLVFSTVMSFNNAMANTYSSSDSRIYKILLQSEWNQFASSGHFLGSPVDLKDKFIHFSAADQIEGVLSRYYQNAGKVYIVEYKASSFGSHLKWESASSGEIYPHVYGMSLNFSDITNVEIRSLNF